MNPVYCINPKLWRLHVNPDHFKNECNTKAQALPVGGECYTGPVREKTSRELLAERLRALEQEYADLDELQKALPQVLGYQADRALRRLIQTSL